MDGNKFKRYQHLDNTEAVGQLRLLKGGNIKGGNAGRPNSVVVFGREASKEFQGATTIEMGEKLV